MVTRKSRHSDVTYQLQLKPNNKITLKINS